LLKHLGFSKGLIYIALGNVLGAALTGFFWLLLASIQSAEDYGKVNFEVAIASLATFGALLGLNTTVTTYTAKGSSRIAVQANQLVLISGGIAAAVISSLFVDWLLGLFIIGMTFWMMSSYELLGKKMYRQYALVVVGARASQLVMSVAFYYLFGEWGIIAGFAISYLLFSYRYFLSIRKFDFSLFDEIKSKAKFIGHAYSFNMSNAFFMYFDKLLIAPIFGYFVLGNYQLGLQFLLFVGMVPISFYQYLLPEEASSSTSRKTRRWQGMAGLFVSVLLATLLFFASPWIIERFFPNFTESLDAIRIMGLGVIPMMVVWILNSRFFSQGNTRYVVVGSAIYLLSQTTLVILLGTRMGVAGLAIATVLALTAQAAFLYMASRRVATMVVNENDSGGGDP
jgi:O-antigen/teichoic acid export membrane protein